MIAPDGAEVLTHSGAEDVVDGAEELVGDPVEPEDVVAVLGEDEIRVLEEVVLVVDVVGGNEPEGMDEDSVRVVKGMLDLGDEEYVVDAAVLMQEQPLEIFEGRLEQ